VDFCKKNGGIFTLTDVKRMRSTDAFLEMPLAQRKCEAELYEECRTRKLLGECGCVPWEMPGFQGMKKCNPEGRDCIEKKATSTFNCSIACNGIYADVQWVENILGETEEKPVEDEVEKKLSGKYVDEKFMLVYKNLKQEMEMIKGSIFKKGDEHEHEFKKLMSEYKQFKKNQVQHFKFDSASHSTSFGEELPPSILQLVQIYFDTATFDDIERDKKIKTEAQLSLIGGTMGLLTGFSIISGVEIIFFLFRLVCSFRIKRADVVAVTKEKFQNHLM